MAVYEHPPDRSPIAFARRDPRARGARRCRRWPRAPIRPGARVPEPDCGLRTPFQRDRDRIVHCKAFRRLKHKTQVFVAPSGDHYRTRLTHTLEVTQVSRTVARALRAQRGPGRGDRARPRPRPPAVRPHRRGGARPLPARAVRRAVSPQRAVAAGGRHARARRRGLNLTRRSATGSSATPGARAEPATLEGRIVRLVDRVAYINHDIDDAVRAGVLAAADLPGRADRDPRRDRRARGSTRSSTISSSTPAQAGEIVQGERVGAAMSELREFMFERVYLGPVATREHVKIDLVIGARCSSTTARIPRRSRPRFPTASCPTRVTDYIAGMTDRFCIRAFEAADACRSAFAP